MYKRVEIDFFFVSLPVKAKTDDDDDDDKYVEIKIIIIVIIKKKGWNKCIHFGVIFIFIRTSEQIIIIL